MHMYFYKKIGQSSVVTDRREPLPCSLTLVGRFHSLQQRHRPPPRLRFFGVYATQPWVLVQSIVRAAAFPLPGGVCGGRACKQKPYPTSRAAYQMSSWVLLEKCLATEVTCLATAVASASAYVRGYGNLAGLRVFSHLSKASL